MKKSFLALLAAATLGLVACGGDKGGNGGNNNPQPEPGPQGPEIEVPEGKIAFYLELKEESVAIPEYAALYVTGTFNGWSTAPDGAVRLSQLQNTNIYFGLYDMSVADLKATLEEWGEEGDHPYAYQITVGYTEESGAPGAGVDWTYKTAECAVYEYGTNPEFVVSDNGLVALGEHTVDKVPGEPVKIENVTLSVEFAEAVPEWVDIFIPGVNGVWDATNKMTPNEERTIFTFVVAETVPGVIGCKIVAEPAGATALSWTHEVLNDNGENLGVQVLQADSNETISLNTEFNGGEPVAYDWSVFPDPNAVEPITLDVVVIAAEEMNLTDLQYAGWNGNWTPAEMATEDNHTFTLSGLATTSKTPISFAILRSNWHVKIQPTVLFTTLDGDTTATIQLTEAGTQKFLRDDFGEEEWVELEVDADYTVLVELTNIGEAE